jgi:DNA topoisomerase-3
MLQGAPAPLLGAQHERAGAVTQLDVVEAREQPHARAVLGRELERDEVTKLLSESQVGPLEGFRSKMGRPFSALVKLDPEFKQSFDFGNAADSAGQAIDLATATVVGTCPVCGKGTVYDTGNAFVCDHSVGAEKSCTFRMGKVILQREIPVEQVRKLLETGKTDLIPRFISKKGRPFSAYLKLENGKVGFEFEPRKAAVKKPAASKKAEA